MLILSHTANQLYIRCPASYHIRYNLKLNEKVVGSALPFGTAIDAALNVLLLEKDLVKAKQVFTTKWLYPEINKQTVLATKTDLIRYSKTDLDKSMLGDEELQEVIENNLSLEWHCLAKKGSLMLEAYAEQILPQIREVIAVQKNIEIDNGIGDKIIGVVDLIAVMKDGRTMILDNKTSSKAYSKDAVEKEGHQLALYDYALKDEYKINGQGFIVIEKNIRKKTGVHINLVDGVVPQGLADEVIESMDKTLRGIKSGDFHSNHPECKSFFGPCLCQLHSLDSYENLVYTGTKK